MTYLALGGENRATRMRAAFSVLILAASGLAGVACDTGVLVHEVGDGNTSDSETSSLDGIGNDIGGDHGDGARFDVPSDVPTTCVTDMDCDGNPAGGHCNLATQMCEPCLQDPNTCSAGMYCDSTFHCVAGCSSDPDCVTFDGGAGDGGFSGGRCNVPTHTCVQCLGDPDCPSTLVCRSNRCVMGCSDTRTCPGTQDCCDGACTDLLTDNAHCGSCAHTCDSAGACCGGICFELQTDPRHCGTCTSVCSVNNAVAGCALGTCTVADCTPGYGDCDLDPSNGCEVQLSNDPNHCGTCANACTSGTHVVSSCTSGVCSATCAPGFLHCSSDPTAGCEVNPATDPNNCGVCGNVCTGAHVSSGGCSGGACTIGTCLPGYTDCDGLPSDGCEAQTSSDTLNCGACFHVCPSGPFSMPTCTSGTCAVSCVAGHGDCNGMAADGCEAAFATDTSNCGVCGTVCPAVSHGTPVCASGSCNFVCSGTFQDCNGVAADGCEADLNTSPTNCGECHNVCAAAHATTACTMAACTLTACSAGFGNCNGVYADGCETPTTADPLNCGACNNTCTAPAFATATCASSTCGFACVAGHANCDGMGANGCEVELDDTVNNCGSCGHACPTPANSTATCSGSACGYTCNPGFADCDGLPANGCEANLSSSGTNCGVCGNMCAFPHATASCMSGACGITACAAGFANCDGMLSNGCETNTTGDLNNCGSCLNLCPMGPNATPTCVAGVCGDLCAPGFANCTGNPDNGCNVTLATDPANCGSCGHACAVPTNSSATCSASTCGYACLPTFADCNHLPADGCEINTSSNPADCGGCGLACSAPNTAPGCSAGACTIGTCSAGYADCNSVYSDGCEVHTAVDSSNCGACGHVCTGGTICVASVCTLVDPFPSTGALGAFNPATNTVLPPGVYNYTTITIPAGVTVSTNGTGVLDLRATGAVTISGTIDVSGGPGGPGVRTLGFGSGGGYTAQNTTATSASATGAPGLGGQAPVGSNAAGCGTNAVGGTNGGGAGGYGVTAVGGGGGGGPGGGGGGLLFGTCVAGAGGGGATAGAGGQAGGPPYDGSPGQSGNDPCAAVVAGGGGGSIGGAAAADLAMTTTFQSGSGGGGGSGSYSVGLSAAEGAGGGGGGAVRISSPTTITINAGGIIRSNGGGGGAGSAANTFCSLEDGGAGGGGGSGGAIYLAAPTLNVTGTVNAVGAAGGATGTNNVGGAGGAGGLGRIRLMVSVGTCTLTGTFNPPLHAACAITNLPGFTYINGYPF